MAVLAMDLGGTKLSSAIFSSLGEIVTKEVVPVNGMKGNEVAKVITTAIQRQLANHAIKSIGISVPGISRHKTGTVWAPNIEGWEDYPLANEIQGVAGRIPVGIDDDRACSIFGEQWQGHAKGCKDVVFLAIGTGIGAGILSGGNLIRGSQDIAGAIGWWALQKPFIAPYSNCGCFEYYASGGGIPKLTNDFLQRDATPSLLRNIHSADITAHQVFDSYDKGDRVAVMIIQECIT
ncbi:MAG TPA: ROK family protein, partial [Chryseolinea sp.]|nr:ROK family protein [Chryseolinea sp.]